MKKTFLTIAFVVAFAAWTIYLHNKSSSDTAVAAIETLAPQPASFVASSSAVSTSTQKTKPTTPSSTPTTASSPAKKTNSGKYVDGIYTGSTADAYYGYVQVQAVVSGGKLARIDFLQYPGDRGTSIRINSRALPLLRQEAIQSQSANVQTVSGATDSSGAFRQSLASALAQAKNG